MQDLNTYYSCRNRYDQSFGARMSLKTRVRMHPVMWRLVALNNRLGGLRTTVLYDHRKKSDKPKIFAVTHIGKKDIEITTAVIRDHYFLLSGDYEHMCGTPEEKLLAVNGVVYVRKDDREDRRRCKDKMVELLKQGGNIMYFPEGVWNFTENLPLRRCPYGIIDVAMRGDAEIIPVAVEQYGQEYVTAVGENFSVEGYSSSDKLQAIEDLRNTMATLKWDIWDYATRTKGTVPEERQIFENQVAKNLAQWTAPPSFIEKTTFHPKGIVNEKEVYDFLPSLPLGEHNAFLAKIKLQYLNTHGLVKD